MSELRALRVLRGENRFSYFAALRSVSMLSVRGFASWTFSAGFAVDFSAWAFSVGFASDFSARALSTALVADFSSPLARAALIDIFDQNADAAVLGGQWIVGQAQLTIGVTDDLLETLRGDAEFFEIAPGVERPRRRTAPSWNKTNRCESRASRYDRRRSINWAYL